MNKPKTAKSNNGELFFIKFDNYFIKKQFNIDANELSLSDRKKLFNKFYNSIKDLNVANYETVRNWFGINERRKPKRVHLIRLAFALKWNSKDLDDCIVLGISEPCLQVNDYKEFIVMYCLDNGLSYDTYKKTVQIYEDNYNYDINFAFTTHTSRLKKFYAEVKNYNLEDFIIWIIKNMSLFKGYSKVTYDCFIKLMDSTYAIVKENIHEELKKELSYTDFSNWAAANNITEREYDIAIPRYVKNKLRVKSIKGTANEEHYREIRNLAKIAYSKDTIMKESIKELWPFLSIPLYNNLMEVPESDKKEFLSNMSKFSPSYVTNLVHIKEQKQEELGLIKKYNEAGEKEKQELKQQLKDKRQRVRQINRLDLLAPAHYVSQNRFLKTHKDYDPDLAKKEFEKYANDILKSCGMRELDENYETDYIILSSFNHTEVTFLSDLFDE
ncbi:MAG: hypothetical protein K6D02_00920 [Lachnospiraceae bacterium]|nr:hypothetical protein [Lachnospiraceae bacterium]